MEVPEFMNYANKFSQSDFVEKIARIAKRAGAKLVYAALILFYTLRATKSASRRRPSYSVRWAISSAPSTSCPMPSP